MIAELGKALIHFSSTAATHYLIRLLAKNREKGYPLTGS
jgi:hypothetical protein